MTPQPGRTGTRQMEALLGADQPKFRAQQIYDAVYRRRVTELDRITNLPKPLRAEPLQG